MAKKPKSSEPAPGGPDATSDLDTPRNADGLRTDGPTLEQWIGEGNLAADYPPPDFAPIEEEEDDDDRSGQAPAASIDAADQSNYEATLLGILPDAERRLPGALLFAEACIVYGVNPDPAARPVEILLGGASTRFRFYKGDEFLTPPTPDRVKFVTAGGVKVCHPIDQDFDAILRRWFRTAQVNPRTKELEERPLPDELTLPREAVTGVVQKQEHRMTHGYLRRRALDAARSGRG